MKMTFVCPSKTLAARRNRNAIAKRFTLHVNAKTLKTIKSFGKP